MKRPYKITYTTDRPNHKIRADRFAHIESAYERLAMLGFEKIATNEYRMVASKEA